MLAAQLFHRHSGFRFLQETYDLAFRKLRLLHVDLSRLYCATCAMSFPLISGTILGDAYRGTLLNITLLVFLSLPTFT